jgi:acetyl esterase/lipase
VRSSSRITFLIVASLLVFLSSGCNQPSGEKTNAPAPPAPPQQPPAEEPKVTFPALGSPKQLEKGVDFYEVALKRAGQPMRVWVYVPEHTPGQKLPCVLVGPAGSPLILGMDLTEGDRAEHLPYVRAGYVVVSYEIDGRLPNRNKATQREIIVAATTFKAAKAGVLNARTALDFALEKVPEIDSHHLYSAGHSSAATLSLLVASSDPRIKGCAAFAPVTDVEGRIGRRAILELSVSIPGYDEFMKASSPMTQTEALKCPVFLFHARDDTSVPFSESVRFAEALKQTNSRVTFAEVAEGDHYDSMIKEGIPRAIEWFGKLRE